MIFHTKRNCFLKEESLWEGAESGMLGFTPSEEENASQEEKRRRGSLAVMEGWAG